MLSIIEIEKITPKHLAKENIVNTMFSFSEIIDKIYLIDKFNDKNELIEYIKKINRLSHDYEINPLKLWKVINDNVYDIEIEFIDFWKYLENNCITEDSRLVIDELINTREGVLYFDSVNYQVLPPKEAVKKAKDEFKQLELETILYIAKKY